MFSSLAHLCPWLDPPKPFSPWTPVDIFDRGKLNWIDRLFLVIFLLVPPLLSLHHSTPAAHQDERQISLNCAFVNEKSVYVGFNTAH